MAKTDGRVESSNNYWHGKLSPHIHFCLASSLLRRLALGCFGRRRWHGQALQSLARCSNARTTTATTAAVADALIDHGHHPARPTCEESSFKQPKYVRIRQIQEKLSKPSRQALVCTCILSYMEARREVMNFSVMRVRLTTCVRST